MGLPRSLSPAERLALIAGDTRWDARDVHPTGEISRYRKGTLTKAKNDIIVADTSTLLWDYGESIDIVIPERPVYQQKDGIAYSENQDYPLAMNEIEVPDSELIEFNESTAKFLPGFKQNFYDAAAILNALDDAEAYVPAALSDGLGIQIIADQAIQEAFVPVSRLKTIMQLVDAFKIDPVARGFYVERLSNLLAEKTIEVMDLVDKAAAARRRLHTAYEAAQSQLSARVKPTEQQHSETANSSLGIVGRRR